MNHHYGGNKTAVFLDPPYENYDHLYGAGTSVAQSVAEWARANETLKIAIAGHKGDYEMPGWSVMEWKRASSTYSGTKTRNEECVWFSPACVEPAPKPEQIGMEWGEDG